MKKNVCTSDKTYAKGLLLALTAGILWGMTGPLGQYLFDSKGVIPDWIVPYRMLAAGGMILLALFIKKKNEIFLVWRTRQDALQMRVSSVAGMMAVQYSFFVAVEASNGGTATVLQYTNPVMIIIYMAIFKNVRPTIRETIAIWLALAGIFLLATNGNIHTLVITPKGLAMGLLCAFFTCLYSMLPKKLLEKYDATVVCGWSMLTGGAVLGLWRRPWSLGIEADVQVWGLFLILVVAGTVIPFAASLKAIPIIGPVYANVLASIEPVVASVLTFAFLGTQFGKMELFGFALVILTILILALQKEKNQTEADS